MSDHEHPLWPALEVEASAFESLSARVRSAVLRCFELSPARRAGRDLGRVIRAPWFDALDDDDRIRALRIVAYVSALAEGARAEPGPTCRRRILLNTLDSLLSPAGRLRLAFEDLELRSDELVAGLRRAPDLVVLNRRAITAEVRRLGEGPTGEVERRVGTCTLVHEVNHLCNPTPVGPTYAAFVDEYRAWLVDFMVFAGRRPRVADGWQRCQQVLTGPRYAAVGGVLRRDDQERERVVAFLRRFGAVDDVAQALATRRDDFESEAPWPEPLGNVDNAALRDSPTA